MPHKLTYYDKISLKHKTTEEAERIIELFNKNINLANRVAQKYYKTKYWDFDEAVQIARMGLWKACLIWDPEKYRLSTLAYNIINRDFIDFDRQQKRQPDILFNLEDNCVTDDLSLSDVLVDEEANIEEDFVQDDDLNELNKDILYVLEDIADENQLSRSTVKLIYVVFLETTQGNDLSIRTLDFIPKQVYKQVILELQERLANVIGRY